MVLLPFNTALNFLGSLYSSFKVNIAVTRYIRILTSKAVNDRLNSQENSWS